MSELPPTEQIEIPEAQQAGILERASEFLGDKLDSLRFNGRRLAALGGVTLAAAGAAEVGIAAQGSDEANASSDNGLVVNAISQKLPTQITPTKVANRIEDIMDGGQGRRGIIRDLNKMDLTKLAIIKGGDIALAKADKNGYASLVSYTDLAYKGCLVYKEFEQPGFWEYEAKGYPKITYAEQQNALGDSILISKHKDPDNYGPTKSVTAIRKHDKWVKVLTKFKPVSAGEKAETITLTK